MAPRDITHSFWLPTTELDFNRSQSLLLIAESYKDYNPNFIPPGVADPNYVPPNKGDVIAIVSIVAMSVAFLFVTARIIIRSTWRGMNMGLDDWMIIPATVSH
jgi:hypothetical protein